MPNTRLKCEYASERAIASCTPASRSFSVFSASSVADLARRQRSQEHPSPLAIVGLGLSRCAPLDAILRSQFAGEGGQRLADRVARRARRLVGRGGELAAARRDLDEPLLQGLASAVDEHVRGDPVGHPGTFQGGDGLELAGPLGKRQRIEIGLVDDVEDAAGLFSFAVDEPEIARMDWRDAGDSEGRGRAAPGIARRAHSSSVLVDPRGRPHL